MPMKMLINDQSQVLFRVTDAHENKWVAFTADYTRIVGVADTLRELLRTVSDPTAVFYKVLPKDVSFAP
jgi:hypothetical protein